MTNDPDPFDVPVRGTYGGDYGPETYNVISLPLGVSFKDLWMQCCNSNNPSINREVVWKPSHLTETQDLHFA